MWIEFKRAFAYAVSLLMLICVTLMTFAACKPGDDGGKPWTPPELIEKPNMLWITTDHFLPSKLYTYNNVYGGQSIAQTPVYDEFLAGATEFENSYSICPICSPARRAWDTAVYPHKNGVRGNDQYYSADDYTPNLDYETFYHALDRAGYAQYHFGKWHGGGNLSPATPQEQFADLNIGGKCFAYNVPGDNNRYGNPYVFDEYRDYLKRIGCESNVNIKYDSFFANKDRYASQGKMEDIKNINFQGMWSGELQADGFAEPEKTHEAYFISSLVSDQLRELKSSGSNKPFNIRMDIYGPHQPYYATKEFLDLYDETTFTQYASFKEELIPADGTKNKPPAYLSCHNGGEMTSGTIGGRSGNSKLANPNNPVAWSEYARFLKYAHAQASLVDAAIGTLLDTLAETGFDKNTVVVWTTDHGDSIGSHGGQHGKDSYMSEEILQVPLAIRYPGVTKGEKSKMFVNSADIPATIVAAGSASWNNEIDGINLMPVLTGEKETLADSTIVVHNGFWYYNLARTIYKGKYKYTFNYDKDISKYYPDLTDHFEELYDMEADPYNMKNLAYVEGYQQITKELREEIFKWQVKTGDNMRLVKV